MPGLAEMLSDGMPAKLNRGEWSPELESNFNRDMQFAPGWRDWRREFIEREGVAPNTDPGGDYNYRLAYLAGATPGLDPGTGETHGHSRAIMPPYKDPVDLKAGNHPTAWKETFMQMFGKNPDIAIEANQLTPEMSEFITDEVIRPMAGGLNWGAR